MLELIFVCVLEYTTQEETYHLSTSYEFNNRFTLSRCIAKTDTITIEQ
jgi:hypothetical protein